MPLYEYYCSTCRSRFELLRSMSQSSADARCPECDTPARRTISVFAMAGREGEVTFLEPGSSAMGSGGCCAGGCGCGS